jgi:hypothetical protein
MPPCEQHDKIAEVLHRLDSSIPLLQKDIEYLRRDQETILCRFGKHVDEADKDGGWHQRIIAIENDIRNTKIMGRWFMIGSGVIGGLIGSKSIDVVAKFLGLFQ